MKTSEDITMKDIQLRFDPLDVVQNTPQHI